MTGIGGVLGGLISDDTPKPEHTEPARPTTREAGDPEGAFIPPESHNPSGSSYRPSRLATHARAGRPPGKSSPKAQRKAKLTVRIDADLVEKYRDWSWDARCNLGELVGRAMRLYLKNRRRDG